MKTASTTVYLKKPNGRYEEYGQLFDHGVWPMGTHAVITEPGLMRVIYNVAPNGASNYAMIAAIELARMAMEQAMCKAANKGVSMRDIIDAGIQALKKSME